MIDPAGFLAATTPWQSRAGGSLTLRGRRRDHQGTTLHFVHGNSFAGGVYWPMLRELTPQYGLFCHDLEGHGDSDRPARYNGAAHSIARIAAVIAEQLPQRPLIGVGHSYGAAMTVRTAAAHPDLFRALVLLDPILLPPATWIASRIAGTLGANPMSRTALRRRDRWPDADAAARHLRGRGIYRGWTDEAFDCFIAHATRDQGGERTLSCPRELEAAIFSTPPYPWRALRQLSCPVLLVHGEKTYPFMPRTASLARRGCASLQVRTQAGGHCFMLEDPVQTAATIRDFLVTHGY